MKLTFIRHGQGMHNTNFPDRLNFIDPRLTEKGKTQVDALKEIFTFNDEDDLFFVSPTIRTIETANIITSTLSNPKKYITPLVGPRMFPMPDNAESHVLKCDWLYPLEQIQYNHSDFIIMDTDDLYLWTHGINTTNNYAFATLGNRLISRIKGQATVSKRAFIIAHDGTITSYRVLLGEEGLTRADFLGEAGWYSVNL